jgi:hypothetical protein
MRSGQLGERHVALDHQRLGGTRNAAQAERRRVIALVRHAVTPERGVLAVIDDGHAEHPGVLEGPPHQERARHRLPVVGERDAPGRFLFAELGELLPFRSHRHSADRIHVGQTRFRRLLEHELRDAGVIVHRIGVGHARNTCEAAGNRRSRPRRDRFFVFLPRLAQVHVDVDEPRRHDPPARDLEDVGAGDRQIPANPRNAAVLDSHVERTVPAVCRIDHPPAFQQQLHLTSPARSPPRHVAVPSTIRPSNLPLYPLPFALYPLPFALCHP